MISFFFSRKPIFLQVGFLEFSPTFLMSHKSTPYIILSASIPVRSETTNLLTRTVFERISGQTTAYVTYPSTSTETLPTTNATLSAVQPNGQTLYQYNPTAFGRGQPPTYPYSFMNAGTYAARAYVPVPGTGSASIGNPTSYEMTQLANVITQNNNAVIGLPDGLSGGLSLALLLGHRIKIYRGQFFNSRLA